MRRLFGFGAILLIATGLAATSARADDPETCRVSSGDEAIAACTRAIASGKYKGNELADIYDNRGVERKTKGDIDGAISDYEQAIKLNPKSAYAFSNRGLARQAKGDVDGAMADFNQAIRLDPKYAHAYGNRGDAKKAKGDLDGAIADYDQSIQLDPKNVNAYNNRGNAKKSKNDFDGAIADYDQAIRLDPKFAFAYDNRGDAKKAKGDLDGAMADYNQAIRIDPSYTSAYTDLGLVYELKNDIANARAEFNVAISVPAKYDSGKWAQDTAREHLAKLAAPPNQRTGPSVVTTPVVNPPIVNPPIVNPPVASAVRRVALVIGNSAYTVFPQLPNPRNDAEDLAKALKDLGFDVLLGTDLKRADMEDIFIRFAKKARESDTALVFYAGHGLQHQGINYLAPVDSRLDDEADLRKLTNLQDVIDDLQRAGHVRILIVDACRDNEVVKQLAARLPSTRSAAFTRGLAAISGADGTLIAFATQPNRVAADGAGRNSPFTQSLLKNLQTPGLELRTLMTRVRAEVVTATGGTQRPEVWDSLVGEFAFKTAQ